MRVLVFALLALLAAVAFAQDYKGWTRYTREACYREKQLLCRKSESNYNSKVSYRISKLNIVKSVEVKLAQARAVVKSVKTELQFAQLALVKAQAEEKTALKYTTWVCKDKMKSKKKFRLFKKINLFGKRNNAETLRVSGKSG